MKHLLFVLALLAGTACARDDQVQIHGNPAGTQTLTSPEPGVTAADYRFSDRGRGDVIQARWRLDAHGLPVSYDAKGQRLLEGRVQRALRARPRRPGAVAQPHRDG